MIPVCEPFQAGQELQFVSDCLESNWISSKGKYIQEFEESFSRYCGCDYGVTTTSGTTALHLALASLGIGKEDEVIVPAFTMISTAFAIVYTGAKPVLVDCDRETWNADVNQIEKAITPKTKAILPVHIYGHPCDMDPILDLAKEANLHVVEDAAEAHGAEYKGRRVGGIGSAGCFSFYANKIITTGEGGMIVTNDRDIAQRARSLKDLAFSADKRFVHTALGFNYRMTNVQAAIGLAQFSRIDELVERRRRNARLYSSQLKDVRGLTLPIEAEWARNVYWMYSILIEDDFAVDRDGLMKRLAEAGVETRTFFIPMHRQPVFLDMGLFQGESYPVAEDISARGLYLPSGSGLSESEVEYVCGVIREIGTGKA